MGALRHRKASDLIDCCCISITKREPCAFEGEFSPKAPQSVKKTLPVRFDRVRECGPSRGAPSYSLTSSVSEASVAEREMTDCLRRSAR